MLEVKEIMGVKTMTTIINNNSLTVPNNNLTIVQFLTEFLEENPQQEGNGIYFWNCPLCYHQSNYPNKLLLNTQTNLLICTNRCADFTNLEGFLRRYFNSSGEATIFLQEQNILF